MVRSNQHSATLLVLGAGSLSSSIITAIAATVRAKLPYQVKQIRIVCASRSVERAEWIAHLSATATRNSRASIEFSGVPIDWDSTDSLASLIATTFPNIILNTASLQSPWSIRRETRWGRLISDVGYGVTLPLQGALIPRVWRAMRSAGSAARLINAAYPDLVNPFLKFAGIDIACGVGNVSIVAKSVEISRPPRLASCIRVLAGHYHVGQLMLPHLQRKAFPRIWCDETEVSAQEALKLIAPLPVDNRLNQFTAIPSAQLLLAMLTGAPFHCAHVPGFDRLVGGVPVRSDGSAISLFLPQSLSIAEAEEWLTEAQALDGAFLANDGLVRFSDPARKCLSKYSVNIAGGVRAEDIELAASELLILRERLST